MFLFCSHVKWYQFLIVPILLLAALLRFARAYACRQPLDFNACAA